MPLRIVGMRLGVNLFTPHGNVRNGEIALPEQQAYLRSIGYRLQPAPPIQPPTLTDEERENLARVERDRQNLAAAIGAHMRDLLAPLRKTTYRDSM